MKARSASLVRATLPTLVLGVSAAVGCNLGDPDEHAVTTAGSAGVGGSVTAAGTSGLAGSGGTTPAVELAEASRRAAP